MTDLQQATAKLAEKAGEGVQMSPNGEAMHWKEYADMAHHSSGYWDVLPGADSTYTAAEVNTVLEWLAKAGYMVQFFKALMADHKTYKPFIQLTSEADNSMAYGKTLSEALANAVRKLEL